MSQTKRLELVYRGMIRSRPQVRCGIVLWPWVLTDDQRTAVESATRGEYFNDEHYGRVLDSRIGHKAVPTGKKRNGAT